MRRSSFPEDRNPRYEVSVKPTAAHLTGSALPRRERSVCLTNRRCATVSFALPARCESQVRGFVRVAYLLWLAQRSCVCFGYERHRARASDLGGCARFLWPWVLARDF